MTRSSRSSRDVVSIVIELVVAFAMIAIGVYMTIEQANAETPVISSLTIGTVLTSLGGIFASWTLSRLVAARSATREIRERLKPINVNMGQHLGSIQNVLRLNWTESELGGIRRLLREAAEGISLQVSHVQSLIGEDYANLSTDPTFERLDQQRERLERAVREQNQEEVKLATRGIAESLGELKRVIKTHVRAAVTCPECSTGMEASIREEQGSTTHVLCRNCGHAFAVHRRAGGVYVGSTLARPAAPTRRETGEVVTGPIQLIPVFTPCPRCESEIPISGRTRTRRVICLNCAMSFEVTPDRELTAPLEFSIAEVPLAVTISGRGYAECPKCTNTYPLLLKREEKRYGFCIEDRSLFWSSEPVDADDTDDAA